MARIRTLLGLLTAAAALMVTAAPAASAHTQAEAILNGCGSGFRLVTDGTRAITTGGSTWGYVHLTYNSATGANCVVTRKTAYHGTPSRVSVELVVQNDDTYYRADNAASHWESVTHNAAGRCVMYSGWVWNPAGTVVAYGGRQSWGNCG